MPVPPHSQGPADGIGGLLDDVLRSTQEAEQQRRTRLEAFLATRDPWQALVCWLQLRAGEAPPGRRAITDRLVLDIAAIDRWLRLQVDAILHTSELQAFEASWRGVAYLVREAAAADGVIVRLLDVNWRTLARDLERAIEFDQSVLFRKVYSDEFGSPGGQPYGLLLGDYQIAHRPRPGHPVDDTRVLRAIGQVAAAAFAPFVTGAHPSLFGLDSFRGFGRRIDFARVFAQPEYVAWNAMRGLDDSRFLAITLPRVLMRRPWRPDPRRADAFCYDEDVSDPSGQGYLWGNACFTFGGVAIRAFESSGWFGDIRGVEEGQEGGGLVTDLVVAEFADQVGGITARPVTEVVVTDTQERALADLGFIPLCALQGLPWAAFYGTPSLQRVAPMDSDDATASARLSAMLQYILCTSRIAHYLKVMCRDRSGSYTSADDIERTLRDWLQKLSVNSAGADAEALARYPLAETDVSVREVPGKPGTFASVIHLRPHFQLDQMSSSIRLMTEILTAR